MFTTRLVSRTRSGVRILIALVGLVASGPGPADASSVLYRSDADLVRMSDRVVRGRVQSVRTERRGGVIYTVARLAVLEDFTGGTDAEIDIHELGGSLDGSRLFITGRAEFQVGQDVIVCLERFGPGLFRNVALSFSTFDVVPESGGTTAAFRQQGAVVVGQTAPDLQRRTPDDFRSIVSAVKGAHSVTFAAPVGPSSPQVAQSTSTGTPEFGQYTLLGSGIRWNQAETGAIAWYRNPDAPAPVTAGNSEAEILTALQAWTAPTSANLTLTYAGTRSLGGQSPYCTSVNAGVGLISYEDPTNEVGSGVLAIGGGCSTSAGAKTVNGQYFASFSHAFVIFNTAAELGPTYRTSTNFARVLTHEIGHAIGLGHTPTGIAGATTNMMYPSCCYSNTPIAPALGPDDLEGLAFIYPSAGGPSCGYTVTPTSTSVSPNAGQFVVAVTTSANCTWQVTSQSAWLTPSTTSGTGSGMVVVSHAQNVGSTRLGSLTVAGAPVSVMQSQISTPASCSYGVFPTTLSTGAGGGPQSITMTVTSGCAWTAASAVPWAVVTSGQSGVGSGTVTLVVDANTGPSRTGSLLVAGQTITVTQAAGATTCSYTLSSTAFSVAASGGQTSVTLTTGSTCPWSASADDDWLAVTSTAQGMGPATVTMVVNANQGAQRNGTVTVAGRTVTVTQSAASTSCSFVLVPSQTQFQSMGGATTMSVLGAAGCGWSAASTAPWLAITGGATGTGNGVVSVSVAANTGPSRTAMVMMGGEALAIVQGPSAITDADLDGLPDAWETQFGLSAGSAAAQNGATGDPDNDARSNLTEYQQGSHPLAAHVRYLAEGATGGFFSTTIALANPGLTSANVLLRFQTDTGTMVSSFLVVPPRARRTFVTSGLAALVNHAFSTVIESDELIVADRRMEWDGASYGGHSETSIAAPATEWYLAEGATHSGFELFYLLQNPGTTTAQVEITYLLPSPQAPLVRTYTVAPASRFNIWVDHEHATLANTDVSAIVRVTNDASLIVERSMYLNAGGQLFGAGHNSAAVRAPALDWFLAEGATGPYFDTFVLIANPSPSDAAVTANFLLPNGSVVTRTYAVGARSRRTIWVDYETSALANTAFSVDVHVTNGVGVIVERSMWWPGSAATWQEAHNTPGATQSGQTWAIADGETGGARQADTYLLVANTGGDSAQVAVTLLPEAQAPITRTFTVTAHSRFNVDVRTYFPQIVGQRYGATVEATTPGASIVVERSLYWDALGTHWAAGSVSTATLLP